MILTVTLNPALDKNYVVDNFALTGIHRVQSMSTIPAGKGLNVSRVLKQLEVPTVATGILGGHTGKLIQAKLNEEQVDNDFVWIRAESRCSILIVDQNKKAHTEVIEPGPSIPRGALARLSKKLEELAPTASWVVFSGSPPPDTSHQVYFNLIKLAQQAGAKVVLDTRGPWLKAGIEAQPDVIKPNWDEFQELVGPCYSTVQALEKAKKIVARGVNTVVVSMGSKGALAVHGEERYVIQSLPPIEVVSAVGCGDTLVAGLLATWHAGGGFAEALRDGSALATSNAAHFGAGIFDPQQVTALKKMITVEKIPIGGP
jgi:tagatose 6-phosphate kinase